MLNNELTANSPTIAKYKQKMHECIRLIYPQLHDYDINELIDYSINKRFYNYDKSKIDNSYMKAEVNQTLLEIADYIALREPIVTAFGTMFKHHEVVPNPLGVVVQSFLDARGIHKKEMFKYPKGSEQFEKYNLLQQLDKIDTNGIYGTIGMYSSLLYNSNVATSITSQGRALVSSMTLFFEGFLGNNVKFGSINETLEFVNNVCHEYSDRRFNDFEILDNPYVSIEDCFAKLVLNCEYRWIPNNDELELIWRTVSNLSNEDRNRVYYKNHLYAFMENSRLKNLVINMLKNLKAPMLNSVEVPEEIQDDLKYLSDLLKEYVYYRYMIIDRIDRCDNMMKAITMVSDTDSTIVSVDAWYRFCVELVNGMELSIANYGIDPTLDDGKDLNTPKMEKVLDYNFLTDEIVEVERASRPEYLTPNDNVRNSIVNMMGNILDRLVNDYMEKFCENVHSWNKDSDRKCRIIAKNEFFFKRLLMGQVKKNYASIMTLQEGNIVPEDKQLDVKGIPILAKSSTAETTRKALKKILLEDILKAPVIDQLKFVKDIAIFEKQIIESLYAGSKEYFKPVTIKAATSYEDPMRIQGVKASMVWNDIRPSDVEAIDLTTRNAINVVKVTINETTAESVKESDPEVYEHIMEALKKPEYKGNIDAIAFPFNMDTPKWLMPFINYDLIMEENVSGFPYESVGIKRLGRNYTGYSNIVEL